MYYVETVTQVDCIPIHTIDFIQGTEAIHRLELIRSGNEKAGGRETDMFRLKGCSKVKFPLAVYMHDVNYPPSPSLSPIVLPKCKCY